jgi:hypothetical protein
MKESTQSLAMRESGRIAARAREYLSGAHGDPIDLAADLATARALRDVLVQKLEDELDIQDGSADAGNAIRAQDSIARMASAQHKKATTNAIPAQKVAQLLHEMQRVVESYVHDEATRDSILTAWRQIVVG